ncbi:MAG: LAGLIDADG family homing endonuclease [bacterium]
MKRKCKINTIWSPTLAYVIGMIATDGNLSSDERHISITSKDYSLLLQIRKVLKIDNKIGKKSRGGETEKKYFVLQFGDVNFYKFLESIGLTKAKSRTIPKLKIPNKYFYDFFRGCIDGDGNISVSFHPESKQPQLRLRLCSASKDFIVWIKYSIHKIGKIKNGWIYTDKKSFHTLNYGKSDSIKILKLMYYNGVEIFLKRKYDTASGFIGRVVK